MKRLPVTGFNQLLNLLDPYIPDDFINERWATRPACGPRWQFSPAQLWRVHLLARLTPVHSLNLLTQLLPEQRAGRDFARLRHRHRTPDVRILNTFRARVGGTGTAADQRSDSPAVDPNGGAVAKCHRAHRRHRPARRLQRLQKKDTGTYTAHHAALGGRTLKTGQSRWFVGYKKHSFRLWWRAYSPAVMLVPLVSWVTPANVSEGGLLAPSLHYCDQRWSWWPSQVVADMGYLGDESKRR